MSLYAAQIIGGVRNTAVTALDDKMKKLREGKVLLVHAVSYIGGVDV
jgi:hypothetical protein